MLAGMSSQHANPSHGFRPDPADYAAAEASLRERDNRTVGGFLQACVKWCAEDPDAALAAVVSRWPQTRGTRGPRPGLRPHAAPPPAPGPGKSPGEQPPVT
jgi:hypothetical protein